MNREILFRGKRKDNGEWVESRSILQFVYGAVYLNYRGTWVMVIPETVGQYIGFGDKNGKKIFDGDILVTNKFGTPEVKYSVVYDKEIATYIGTYKKGYVKHFTTFCGDGDEFEVIGNIHDNPELLEEAMNCEKNKN